MSTANDTIHQMILKTIEVETQRIVEEEAKAAALRTEERVRSKMGEIATRIASWVDYSVNKDHLVITVKFPSPPDH